MPNAVCSSGATTSFCGSFHGLTPDGKPVQPEAEIPMQPV